MISLLNWINWTCLCKGLIEICSTFQIKSQRSQKSCIYGRKIWQMCPEILSTSFFCPICLRRKAWCCLQIYEAYLCNTYLRSSWSSHSTFQKIYQVINGLATLTSSPSHLSSLKKKKKTTLILPATVPWKERLIQSIWHIFGFQWMMNTQLWRKKHCEYLSLSLRRIYAKLDFLLWPSLKLNIDHE